MEENKPEICQIKGCNNRAEIFYKDRHICIDCYTESKAMGYFD